jgi:hypothetical protein
MAMEEPVRADGRPARAGGEERSTIGGAFVIVASAVLIAAWIDDSIDARLAWTLVTALAVGYMIGAGLALRRS